MVAILANWVPCLNFKMLIPQGTTSTLSPLPPVWRMIRQTSCLTLTLTPHTRTSTSSASSMDNIFLIITCKYQLISSNNFLDCIPVPTDIILIGTSPV